jgi:hypothetical protein
MRRTSIYLVTLVNFDLQAYAGEPVMTFFYPASQGQSAQTLNLETGRVSMVLEGESGKRPEICPPEAFWAVTVNRIVNCGDGKEYELTQTEASGLKGAFALVRVTVQPPTIHFAAASCRLATK